MTKKQLLKILNDDSLELTVEELENIIEEELQKDDSEMDPDLIEYCLYYISKAEANGGKEKKADSAGSDKITEPPAADKPEKSRFNGKLKNLLIIAATIALLLVTTGIATVATNKKVKNSAITFYENHIQVHFDKQKDESGIPGTEIAAELRKHDISDLKLPAMFLSSDCIYDNIFEDNIDGLKVTSFSYRANNLSGKVSIRKFYSNESVLPIDFNNTTSYSKVEELSVNGLTVFVIEQENFCSIAYQDNLTQYMMYLNTDFAETVEIAKTLTAAEE
ncbi:MAG TPA: hypothetical protein DHF18_00425 [Ruminococcaceae bacterium]|nr:hypothetical protein [Oscillospiraceae bacterium]